MEERWNTGRMVWAGKNRTRVCFLIGDAAAGITGSVACDKGNGTGKIFYRSGDYALRNARLKVGRHHEIIRHKWMQDRCNPDWSGFRRTSELTALSRRGH